MISKMNGKYSSDKYTKIIFDEAAKKFNLSVETLQRIYWGEI